MKKAQNPAVTVEAPSTEKSSTEQASSVEASGSLIKTGIPPVEAEQTSKPVFINRPDVEAVKAEEIRQAGASAPKVEYNSGTGEPEPFQLIPDFKISGRAKTMAKSVGINLSSIEAMAPRMNDWAGSVEKRLEEIYNAIPGLPDAVIKKLRAEAEKQRTEMMQKPSVSAEAPAAKGGFDMASVLEVLKSTGIMGGGGSGVSDEITKQVLDAGLKQMFAGTRLLEAIQTKIMADMGVKAVTEAVAKA